VAHADFLFHSGCVSVYQSAKSGGDTSTATKHNSFGPNLHSERSVLCAVQRNKSESVSVGRSVGRVSKRAGLAGVPWRRRFLSIV